jgi:hypothetical protein
MTTDVATGLQRRNSAAGLVLPPGDLVHGTNGTQHFSLESLWRG